jgi:hypothetical protein
MKKQKNKQDLYLDVVILTGLPIGVTLLSLIIPLNYLQSDLLFLGLPALYLSWRQKSAIKRVLLFTIILSAGGAFIDYLAELDHAWAGPTIFPFKLGGIAPIENLVWFFLITYLIIIFYERFFDNATHKLLGRRMSYLYLIMAVLSIMFCLSLLIDGKAPQISYFYLKLGIFFGVLPLLAFLIEFPRFIRLVLTTAPYFIALSLLNEIIGLRNGYWWFPGEHFIGRVNLGNYSVPFEELIFFVVLFSSVIIAYFELFDDNRLKLRSIRLPKIG